MGKAIGLAVGAVVATIILIAVIAASVSNDNPSTSPTTARTLPATTATTLNAKDKQEQDIATAWNTEADAALNGSELQTAIRDMVTGADDFTAGKKDGPGFIQTLDFTLSTFVRARDAEATLRPFPLAPNVGDISRRSFCLYIDANRLWRVVAALPAGDLRTQADLTARRIRELGDRTFDRATALIQPFEHIPANPDVEVHLSEEVPNWPAEGQAAGPPLDPVAPAPVTGPFPERQATRPTQPRAAWLAAVNGSAAPPIAELLAATTADAAGDFARAADAASESLRDDPDPATGAPLQPGANGREDSARARIRLEIDAEAGRVMQIAFLVADPLLRDELTKTAQRILAAADGMWLPDLAPRLSGIPETVLTQPASAL